jgi:biopolymer transport protein ExbB
MQGLARILQAADGLTWCIFIGLVLMSITSWTLICLKSAECFLLSRWYRRNTALFSASSKVQRVGAHRLYEQTPLKALRLTAVQENSPFACTQPPTALQPLWDARQWAMGAYAQRCLQSVSEAQTWLRHVLQRGRDESGWRLQAGLGVLASIAATAPFLGLLGTVWGIYHALSSIGGPQVTGAGGAALLDTIAGPIAESLVMTALGLGVAIPALLAYNTLLRAQTIFMQRLNYLMRAMWYEAVHAASKEGE